jgi:tripartite-type tricarboxylate transporter receptor subunit TctC
LKRRILLQALAAVSVLAGAMPSVAASWPERPIRMVVPYPAGGGSDNIARYLGERVGAALGQPIVIENRGGAGATIGTQVAANAEPDGYTFLLAPTAVVALTPLLRKVPYDPETLVAVAKVSTSYGMVVARKDLPADTIEELIALSHKTPEGLTFGSAGTATITHLTGEIAKLQLGLNAVHVPYKGSAPSLTDLIGGQIDLIYDALALPAIKNGQVKALAATSRERHPELPEIPTMAELGYELGSYNWYGLFAPKGTPSAMVERMAVEVERVLAEPATREQMGKFSQYPDYMGPAEFQQAVAQDRAFFEKLLREVKIEIE